jgi:hypothetical protein
MAEEAKHVYDNDQYNVNILMWLIMYYYVCQYSM